MAYLQVITTGSIIWVLDVGGVGFMGSGVHTNTGGPGLVCMVYPFRQHPTPK